MASNRRGESKLSPRRIGAVQKQQQALEMRIAGHNWQEIADTLGYSDHSGAFRAVESALQKTLKAPSEEYRIITLERLTTVLKTFWPGMLGGDIQAGKMVLQTVSDIRKLLGLDAPVQMEHSGPDGNPIQHEVVTLDIGDITEALGALQDAGAVRLETNGHHPIALESLYSTQANT